MSLESGQQLLHYRLIEKIGEGGMGVVWKARDTTLDRDVAIKVLPDTTGDQAERLVRFEREAKTLASLNHPNIASVYGLHQADDIRFIVMELIGGEDLQQRLARGPIPVREALAVASQIAEGLSAAHDAGVIHRDLKPANIKLTDDGQVKVLDFGLAKAFAAGSGDDTDLAHSPTLTSAGTMIGMILGTAAYMSPEQARGRVVDRRTDLWAFGAVLFEMLAGSQAFPGSVISEIIAKILEREPEWDALPTPLHPAVRRLLSRCLTKDPKDRLHDAADARIELQDLLLDPTGETVSTGDAGTAATTPLWRRVFPWTIVGALLVWVVLAQLLVPAAAPESVVQFEIIPPLNHEFAEFSTSPDGTAVAFVAIHREGGRTLWVRRLDLIEMEQLEGTEGARFPFWSPDNRSVAFFARGKLRRIDLATKSMQTIADASNGRGGDWSADGTILFTPDGADVLYAIPASGGEPVAVTSLNEGEETHRFPHFLPGTREFTFSGHGPNSNPTHRYAGSLDSDEVVSLPDGMSETYWPGDHVLYVREGNLIAQRFDAVAGKLTGESFPLAQDISDVFPRTARSAYSVSGNGVLMVLRARHVDARFDWYDRYGRTLESVGPNGEYRLPALSHARDRIAFDRFESANTQGVWVLDVARGTSTRLVAGLQGNPSPSWSPDDSSVLYSTDFQIIKHNTHGGATDVLLDGATAEQSSSLSSITDVVESSSGSFVAFAAWDPVTDFNIWLLQLDGKSEPMRLTNAERRQDEPRISPNERFIAYQSNESGRFEVYLRTATLSDEKTLISTNGGQSPSWNEDGSELYYISPDQALMAVSIRGTARGLTVGIPERLFAAPRSVPTNSADFFSQAALVGTDGDRFLFHVPAEELPQQTIEVVLNWEGLLEK